MDAQKYTKTGRRLDNGNETAITTGKFLGKKSENESDQTLTHHMRHLHRNYIGANQFAIRKVQMDRGEKRGEETMNIFDTDTAKNALLHRTTELYRSKTKITSKILFRPHIELKLKHWCGFPA